MHRMVKFLGIFLSFAVLGFWLFGCSGSDLLDEDRYRYSISISPQNGDDDTDDIDVVQSDCNGTAEDMGDFNTVVSIIANSDVPDLQINSFRVHFSPVRGMYWTSYISSPPTNVAFTPPELVFPLNDFEFQFDQPRVMENGTLQFEIRIWSEGMKNFYVYNILAVQEGLGDLVPNLLGVTIIEAETATTEYDVHITFECTDSEGNEFELEADENIDMANYDNC